MKRNRWRVSRFPMALLWGALLLFSCSKHDLRVQQLNDLQAQNQADTVFRSDSLQKILVDHFNRHGTANEKMLANYLLGRAYYDMGETPLALHYYHEAIDCADTTAADCDFKQLGRIHGQTAMLLLRQSASLSALEEFDKASHFALKSKDTLNYIASFDNKGSAYEKLGEMDSALYVALYAKHLYEMYGDTAKAVAAPASMIDELVRQGRLSEAKKLKDDYESRSGFFDKDHNIRKGKQTYYYTAGIYYNAIHRTDSAFFYFHKLLEQARKTNDYECAYEGLSQTYKLLGQKDSALHYSMLAYSLNDSCHKEKTTEDYQRLQKMYNYSRQQQEAERQRVQGLVWKSRMWVCLFVLALLAIATIVAFFVVRQRKRDLLQRERELLREVKELQQARGELVDLLYDAERSKQEKESITEDMSEKMRHLEKAMTEREKELQTLISEKSNEILILENELRKKTLPLRVRKAVEAESSLFSTTIVQLFVQSSIESKNRPGALEWSQLHEEMNHYLPNFFSVIKGGSKDLSIIEEEICMLVRLNIPMRGISYITKMSLQSLSNSRKLMLHKVFGLSEGGAQEFDKRLKQII